MVVFSEGFLEDFCYLVKPGCESSAGVEARPVGVPELPKAGHHHDGLKDSGSRQADEKGRGGADPALRTEPQPGPKDSGWEGPEVSLSEHLETAIKSILDLKKTQRGGYAGQVPLTTPSSTQHHAPLLPQGRGSEKPLPSEHSQAPMATHTDSVLEAAVNSILEC